MNPVFQGKVVNGRISLYSDDRRKMDDYIASLEGKPVAITIESIKSKRTSSQNRYYWGVVLKLISEHTGHIPEDLHELFKLKFNSKLIEVEHDMVEIGTSTQNLSTEDFGQFVDRVVVFAAELGIVIPEPGQVSEEVF